VAAISGACALVEVLPVKWLDDNWSVPVTGGLLASWLIDGVVS